MVVVVVVSGIDSVPIMEWGIIEADNVKVLQEARIVGAIEVNISVLQILFLKIPASSNSILLLTGDRGGGRGGFGRGGNGSDRRGGGFGGRGGMERGNNERGNRFDQNRQFQDRPNHERPEIKPNSAAAAALAIAGMSNKTSEPPPSIVTDPSLTEHQQQAKPTPSVFSAFVQSGIAP